jgi:hypothetical protein
MWQKGGLGRFAIAVLATAVACAVLASGANAAISEEPLFHLGSGFGSGAGQLGVTEGIAADPVTGHIYADGFSGQNRIAEFAPWGEFVKVFGWDVAPGAVNEVQEVRVRASSGSFKLKFGASATSDLPFDATGGELESALDALASIGGAGGSVSVKERDGATNGSIPFIYAITFHGTLGGKDTAALEAEDGAVPLSGGSPSTSLEARTVADGTPGGTGLESCTAESGCKEGVGGGGSGQLRSLFGIATDSSGDLFVRDIDSNRVQEFTSSGRFVLMIGGDVDKTKVEEVGSTEAERNLCTAASGDVCQAGTAGAGKGQFAGGLGVAVIGSTLYVGDKERIQRFGTAGNYLGDLPDPGSVLVGKTVRRLAADQKHGRLYVGLEGKDNVLMLDASTGAKVGEREAHLPEGLASDAEGDLFAVVKEVFPHVPEHVAEFDRTGSQLLPNSAEEGECAKAKETVEAKCSPFGTPAAGYELHGIGTGPAGDLYVANFSAGAEDSFIAAYGPPPLSLESPPPAPPSIDAQYAASVTSSEAEVRAQINPHFFSGSLGTTSYFVQYATAACIEGSGWGGGCVGRSPAAPALSKLKGGVVAEDLTATALLSGLSPHTAYRYRFVAESTGKPGVQIVGVGGIEGVEGADAGLTTHTSPAEEVRQPCPENEAFRTGPSSRLPDCRAYEMVSPVDKEGGEVRPLGEFTTGLPAVLNQSATSGDAFAYGSYKAFAEPQSSLYTTQYISRREGGAWVSRAISPPQSTHIVGLLPTFDTEYKFFSDDLCEGWLRTFAEPTLAPGAVEGYSNIYRRGNCSPAPSYEALTMTPPEGVDAPHYQLELQGLSANRGTAIYAAGGKLQGTNAPSLGAATLLYAYKRGEAEPRFVCILPGPPPTPSTKACSAGGPVLGLTESRQRMVRVEHAISEDGRQIFWTADENRRIYVRENPFGEGAECSEEAAPCTLAVSKKGEELSGTAGKGAQYWGAAADGSKAIYETEDKEKGVANLYEFGVESGATEKIAGKVVGVVGMSPDASRIYLVSEEDLDGPAVAGKPNLYLRDGGKGGENMRFIATLSEADLTGVAPIATALAPGRRATQVSADGEEAAFMSSAPLTGYDNHDLGSGKADREVYLYRATAKGGEGSLICASCNPTGARPRGRNVGGESSPVWAAATIPVAESNLHEARLIADGGQRLYFDSFDSLALADTNGAEDAYQWEASGTGSCEEGRPDFVAAAEGCVDLISSGKSEADSEFTEASPDGSNVFFATLSSLVPQDPGVIDVYDARVNGGLPSPPVQAEECEGESCQHPPAPPPYSAPSSSTYSGPGNKGKKTKKACPKGKVRRHGHCVRKRSHKKPSKRKRGGGK